MGVQIIRRLVPKCAYCGGTKITRHEIISQGKKAIMQLPCVACTPMSPNLPYLGILNDKHVQPVAPADPLREVLPSRTRIVSLRKSGGES